MTRHVIGIDIGGTRFRVALADAHGEIVSKQIVATPADEGPEVGVAKLKSMMEEVLRERGLDFGDVSAIAAGIPGPTDPEAGVLYTPPHLPRWRNVPFAQMLEDATGVSSRVRNDAQVAAYGEYRRGAGIGVRHMLYVTVSTGIGGGIVIDGKVYSGAMGVAGEVGHVMVDPDGPECSCGCFGCLESLASGTAVARIAAERIAAGAESQLAAVDPITGEAVAQAAAAGDVLAVALLERAGTLIGGTLGSMINLLGPEVIALGGGFIQSGPPLLDPMYAAIDRHSFAVARAHTRVEMARLGQDAGLVGAVELARDALG